MDSEGRIGSALKALEGALRRYEAVVDSSDAAFAAATEAAMWVIAIDSYFEKSSGYRQKRDSDSLGSGIPLIRVYRNQMIHAVERNAVDHVGAFSSAFSSDFDRVRLVWAEPDWTSMRKGDRQHRDDCRQRLVGREVSEVLGMALRFYQELLKP